MVVLRSGGIFLNVYPQWPSLHYTTPSMAIIQAIIVSYLDGYKYHPRVGQPSVSSYSLALL